MDVVPLPLSGTVLRDRRGAGRALRVTWHAEHGVVILSLWRDDACVGTFRLPVEDVPYLVDALVRGLAGEPPAHSAPRRHTAAAG